MLMPLSLYSQKSVIHKVDTLVKMGKYYEASEILRVGVSKVKSQKGKDVIRYKLATCYRLMGLDNRAEPLYKRLIARKYKNPLIYLHYGNCLRKKGKVVDAINMYNEYKNRKPDDFRWKQELNRCKKIRKWMSEPNKVSVKKEIFLSGPGDDFIPFYNKKNECMYVPQSEMIIPDIARVGKNNIKSDIYVYTIVNNRWGNKEKVKWFASGADEVSFSMNDVYDYAYVTHCNADKQGVKCRVLGAGFMSIREYDKPERVQLMDEIESVRSPFVAENGNKIYFESSMDGGVGGIDIWVTSKDSKGDWKEPSNMGKRINTKGNEINPCLSHNGALYYATNKHFGMGGYDLVKASKKNKKWKVEMLKYPINSVSNDIAISFTRGTTKGYIISDRGTGLSNYDIFTFETKIHTIEGYIYSMDTGEKLKDIEVEFTSSKGDTKKRKTSSDGYYFFEFDKFVDGEIRLSSSGFVDIVMPVKKPVFANKIHLVKNFSLFKKDEICIINNIKYDADVINKRKSRKPLLELIYQLMGCKRIDDKKAEITVFTNNFANDSLNMIYSKRQARRLQEFLFRQGFSRKSVNVIGDGNRPLIVSRGLEKKYVGIVTEGTQLTNENLQKVPIRFRKKLKDMNNRLEIKMVDEFTRTNKKKKTVKTKQANQEKQTGI